MYANDLTKAFDMVNHGILLEKLKCLGIRGTANDWIKSYLINRRHTTKITDSTGNNYYSKETTINIGVPQGSIIAPLLFILYINDISLSSKQGNLTIFADDTTQFLTNDRTNNSEETDKNNNAVKEIFQWVSSNKLSINKSKTVLLQFHPNNASHQLSSPLIYLNGKSIVPQDNTKFLGIMIDNRLKWDVHINMVCKKISSGCFLIKRMMQICDLATAKLVYYAYIHSRLTYGILLWGLSKHTKRLFILQKRAIRNLALASSDPCTAGMYYKDSCKPYFIKFSILTLPCIFIYSAICLVIENEQPKNCRNTTHNYETRNCKQLKVDKYVSQLNSKNPYTISTKLYNKALVIYNSKSKKINNSHFKNYIKTFLIENAFYSVEQFIEFNNVVYKDLTM
jgi:hypothetical protein